MIPGPFKAITTTELTSDASSFSFTDFSSVPATAKHLVFMLNVRASTGTPDVRIRLNNDTTSSYFYADLKGKNTGTLTASATGSASFGRILSELSSSASTFGGGMLVIPNHTNTSYYKSTIALMGNNNEAVELTTCTFKGSTAAISRVDFFLSSGNFASGSVAIFAVMDESYIASTSSLSGDTNIMGHSGWSATVDDLVEVSYLRTNHAIYNADGGPQSHSYHFNQDYSYTANNSQLINYTNPSGTFIYGTQGFWFTTPRWVPGNAASNPVPLTYAAHVSTIHRPTNGSKLVLMRGYGGYAGASNVAYVGSYSLVWPSTTNLTSVQFRGAYYDQGVNMMTGSYSSIYYLPKTRVHNSASSGFTASGISNSNEVISSHLFLRDASASTLAAVGRVVLNSDSTASNYSSIKMEADGTVAQVQTGHQNYFMRCTGGASGMSSKPDFSGGVATVIKYAKTDRYKHIFGGSAQSIVDESITNYRLEVVSTKWSNTAAITSKAFTLDGGFASGSVYQIEALEPPAAAATSGFFFRFMSIAAPTVGLAAASSYLSWLTSVSA